MERPSSECGGRDTGVDATAAVVCAQSSHGYGMSRRTTGRQVTNWKIASASVSNSARSTLFQSNVPLPGASQRRCVEFAPASGDGREPAQNTFLLRDAARPSSGRKKHDADILNAGLLLHHLKALTTPSVAHPRIASRAALPSLAFISRHVITVDVHPVPPHHAPCAAISNPLVIQSFQLAILHHGRQPPRLSNSIILASSSNDNISVDTTVPRGTQTIILLPPRLTPDPIRLGINRNTPPAVPSSAACDSDLRILRTHMPFPLSHG
ncbi:hypothetical protein BGZ61DRAFT_125911 [Ilyonectria robusta]|uniref:uncharacterized protein n=1 Tax=Ilyonectria robusta TaxID=1079257 RepID=UPI001E8D9E2A|nr:uncharacterized protein BGZ61DRAFT_125911 [Ilyonectria robusta]KAH8734552.1 hypothetical protein BGZ61DRAFT_125911 [Ilyonectria robusta]